MHRYRVSVDMVTPMPLTGHQLSQVQENAKSLINVAAVSSVEGVQPRLEIFIFANAHNHNSTDYEQCAGCRNMAKDKINDDSQ